MAASGKENMVIPAFAGISSGCKRSLDSRVRVDDGLCKACKLLAGNHVDSILALLREPALSQRRRVDRIPPGLRHPRLPSLDSSDTERSPGNTIEEAGASP